MSPTEDWAKRVIGRTEAHGLDVFTHPGRVLVTGGEGSIGKALAERLEQYGFHEVVLTDIHTMDVRDERNVMAQFLLLKPEVVIHLAASKHAPLGEEDPYEVVRTNVDGTRHILDWSRRLGARCVVASTCKACDPETAYGASKLIAERMALNAGQSVARYYNVCETSGNVFKIWEQQIAEGKQPSYTDCKRRFTTLHEALDLTLWVAMFGERAARYTLTHTVSQHMRDVLVAYYPAGDYGGMYGQIQARRGDRYEEPRHAACEQMAEVAGCEWISRIVNPHDPSY